MMLLSEQQYEEMEKSIYDICEALTAIVDLECCTYGFNDAVSIARAYIKAYEEDHPDEK